MRRCATGVARWLKYRSEWFEGNFADYEEDKKRRLGDQAVEPHRIKFKRFER